jgi:hypothetical protein
MQAGRSYLGLLHGTHARIDAGRGAAALIRSAAGLHRPIQSRDQAATGVEMDIATAPENWLTKLVKKMAVFEGDRR